MSRFCLPKNHVSHTLTVPLQKKVREWGKQSPIRYVDFQRIYDTGEILCFSSKMEFMEERLNLHVPFITRQLMDGTYLLDELRPESVSTLVFGFDIYNAISFIKKAENYTDSYVFATDSQNKNCSTYYFNNLDYLKALISESQELFSVFLNDQTNNLTMPHYLNESLKINNSYYERLDYDVLAKELIAKLSENEKICFNYFLKGMTQKEIAKILNVTRSSVGSYLLRAKQKLKCDKRADLIDVAWKLGMIEFNSFQA